jgi:hypothetical protein
VNRRRVLGVAQAAYLVILLAGAAWLLHDRWPQLRRITHGARPSVLLLDLALLCVQAALGAAIWQQTLAVFGEHQPFATLLGAVGRTLPTRYLPGGIWMVVTRASILRRRDVALSTIAGAAVLEQALALVLGLALGAVALLATGDLAGRGAVVLLVGAAGAAACTPPAINALQRVVARGRGFSPVRGRAYGRLVVVMVAYTLWSGLSFAVFLMAFPRIDVSPLRAGGAYLVAWVLGYVAVWAPQGAGVADVATAAMLTSGAVAPLALLIGGFRVVILVRDVIVASAATLQRHE